MLEAIKKDAQTRMTKSVESLRQDLTHLRTGRAKNTVGTKKTCQLLHIPQAILQGQNDCLIM